MSENAGIEPGIVAASVLAVRLLTTRLDLIHTRLDLIHSRLDLIHTRLDLIHTRLDLIQMLTLHCKPCLGEIEQYNYNVSLLALLWSFRNLGVKM